MSTRPKFAWLAGGTHRPPIDADLVSITCATHLGFSSDSFFTDDAHGAALLADVLAKIEIGAAMLVVPSTFKRASSSWLGRMLGREGPSASRALRCTALRLAGYEIVQVIDNASHDAIVARKS